VDAFWVMTTQGLSLRELLRLLNGDLTPLAHLGTDAEMLVLGLAATGALCLLAALFTCFLKATVVPLTEPASPAGAGASALFKLLSALLLLSALASSFLAFAPALPVAALAVAVGSLALPAAHRSRSDTLLVWLFATAAAACALAQTGWLLWYGPQHLLRPPAPGGGVPALGLFLETSDAVRAFVSEVRTELVRSPLSLSLTNKYII